MKTTSPWTIVLSVMFSFCCALAAVVFVDETFRRRRDPLRNYRPGAGQ